MDNLPTENKMPVSRGLLGRASLILIVTLLFLSGLIFGFTSPPEGFTRHTLFTIEEGETLGEVASSLKSLGYIKSEFVLKAIIAGILFDSDMIVAGDYVFDKKLSAFSIALRITNGEYHIDPVRVTIPEGLNKFEIAEILQKELINFSKETFLSIAPEGFLFPDTYFFNPIATPEKVVSVMKANFDKKLSEYEDEITKSGRSLEDVITMASIVETEARKFETRQIIAGILWDRIDLGMPLQVDVSFKYVNGETTAELSLEDLEIDSPYNTYKYAGLPPTPIANPGIDSIIATIRPTKTDYLYFLSDEEGTMHYAVTFEQHKTNKQKYLR